MKPVVLMALLVLAVLMIGGFSTLSVDNANTTTIGTLDHGAEGASPAASTNGGSNALPYNGGELLDSTAYVSSWDTGGLSEKIVATGHLRRDLNWHSIADVGYDAFYYHVTFPAPVLVSTSGSKVTGTPASTWDSPKIPRTGTNLINNNQWDALDNIVFYVQGPISGKMTVDLMVDHYVSWPDNYYPHTYQILQHDEANLISGVGTVTVPKDVAEEGTAAVFHVHTGASHGASATTTNTGGWMIKIFEPASDPNSTNAVTTQNVADWFDGDIRWNIPVGSYKDPSNASTPAGWDNKYVIVLYNQLFSQSHAWLFTVGKGMLTQIPNKPTFKVLEGSADAGGQFKQGESVTIQVSAGKTYYAIKDFIVSVEYIKAGGGDSTSIIDDTHYKASTTDNKTYTAKVTFTMPEAGTISVWADSFDIKGLNSGVAKFNIGVNPYTPPPPEGAFDWGQTLLYIGIIGAIAGALLAFVPGVPEPFKTYGWVLLFIGAALLLVYAFLTLSRPPTSAEIRVAIMAWWSG